MTGDATDKLAASGGRASPRPYPGILRSVLPGVVFAAFYAAGVVAVDAVVAVYCGSYLAAGVILIVALFWASAAALAATALSGVLLPVLLLVKSRERALVLPCLVAGAGFAAYSLVMRQTITARESLGGSVLLNPVFLVAWGALLAVFLLFVARRFDYNTLTVYVLAASANLSCAGLSYFVSPLASAFVLAILPLALLAVSGVVLAALPSGAARRTAGVALPLLFAVVLLGVARSKGVLPLEPISRPYAPVSDNALSRPNVVVIVVDTLRADHTSLCGYKYRTTPNLDVLSRDSQLFPDAASVDSCTLPAHASLFTGKYPRQHGARAYREPIMEAMERVSVSFAPLDPSHLTLATHLSRAGYATGAVVANYGRLCRHFALDQGFSYYYDLPRMLIFIPTGCPVFKSALDAVDRILGRNGKLLQTYHSARAVTERADHWLSHNERRPFFLFLNYMDPHYPYSAAPPFDKIDGPNIPYNMILRQRPWQNFISRFIRTGQGLTPELHRQIVNQYDGEIAYADYWIGKLIDRLKAQGLYDNTLIIITSDHGESFGEHQFLDHTLTLYEDQVRIPILVKYPKQAHAGTIRLERVSIIDIFATVLEAAGIPVPSDVPAQPLGRVTHPIIAENYENALRTRVYGAQFGRDLTAIYYGGFKYVRSSKGNIELYDLLADPAETRNIAAANPEAAAHIDAELSSWLRNTPPSAVPDTRRTTGGLSESLSDLW